MKSLNAALFDLDGTLLDTPPAIAAALKSAVAEVTGENVALQDVVQLVGRPLPILCGRLVGRHEDDPMTLAVVRAYQHRYRQDIVPSAQQLIFPGVLDGLDALRAEGLSFAIVTSKAHHAAESILDAAGLLDRFDVVIGADDVKNPKPAGDAGLKALDMLSVTPEAAIVVGDTADDIRMAGAVPMRSIGVTYGSTMKEAMTALRPTLVVEDFPSAVSAIRHVMLSREEMLS
ncbi:HAD family hydrolase [Clavibacter michiganensis]|uniref:HAD family hydrolase n=1 Tax=Clavibacter michiganensis subsp. insidiosus TaxID=33014 RepID=A0A0D5CHF1_9MICO|nr:HAD family hydrolase [Clavibacter michiganensis]AJW78704.1 hypothetical protein VO01_05785 [Clavibacter michiganensis subsp. insidiosus]AWF98634.1 hypothetical protein BEH61_08970 [Clavibacter michiganensis subsp. insidiosus]AWG01150.1 hypothetical protein BEH62_06015 [Clavibacter michiganensis subsp. insidiosus]OQJ60289.1 hypothetical protein B5P21_10475 [Clavibacter michiganensis subsp. insidiosus]RII88775.1 HAD family hydrolase [Clavibacter michiganensis subsp. insidiosus]